MTSRTVVLFWCYKEPAVCRDRLLRLRQYNPDVPVYVLYGGEAPQADGFREALAGLYSDFWVHHGMPPRTPPPRNIHDRGKGLAWKWYYGDLMLRDWFRERGNDLVWDRIFIMQWDMPVLGPLEKLLQGLEPDEVLFSGLRPVSEVEARWTWTSPEHPEYRSVYEAFVRHMAEVHRHHSPPLCCLAVVMVLTRLFFEKFAKIPQPELGFIEYKLPTFADSFGIRLNRRLRFKVWWDDVEPYRWHGTLHAVPVDIKPWVIAMGRFLPGGPRVFHPYPHALPECPLEWLRLVHRSIRKDLRKALKGTDRRPGGTSPSQ